jgi:hypothetical protein
MYLLVVLTVMVYVQRNLRYSSDTDILPNLAIKNTADVTGGKPIAV